MGTCHQQDQTKSPKQHSKVPPTQSPITKKHSAEHLVDPKNIAQIT